MWAGPGSRSPENRQAKHHDLRRSRFYVGPCWSNLVKLGRPKRSHEHSLSNVRRGRATNLATKSSHNLSGGMGLIVWLLAARSSRWTTSKHNSIYLRILTSPLWNPGVAQKWTPQPGEASEQIIATWKCWETKQQNDSVPQRQTNETRESPWPQTCKSMPNKNKRSVREGPKTVESELSNTSRGQQTQHDEKVPFFVRPFGNHFGRHSGATCATVARHSRAARTPLGRAAMRKLHERRPTK